MFDFQAGPLVGFCLLFLICLNAYGIRDSTGLYIFVPTAQSWHALRQPLS
jgi:hypothetical protein